MKRFILFLTILMVGHFCRGQSLSVASYWFDENFAQRQVLTATVQTVDASMLSEGIHTIHVQMNDTTPVVSSLFYRIVPSEIDSTGTMHYWFDEDFANRQPLTSNMQTIDASYLSEGIHTIHVQMNDHRPVVSSLFYRIVPAEIDSTGTMHYWFDEDFANRQPLTSNMQTIDASHLSEGIHTIHVQMNDHRPVVSSLFYRIVPAEIDSTGTMHYWFDEDFANRQPLTSNMQTIDASYLSEGIHTIHVQMNDYRPVESALFFKTLTIEIDTSAGMQYWFDEDFAHRQQMTSNVQTIDASSLSEGIHTIHVQMGSNFPVTSALFYKTVTSVVDSAGSFSYWFDEDFANRQLLTSNVQTIDASSLSEGIHTIHVQMGGNFPVTSALFYKTVTSVVDSAGSLCYWFDEDFAHRQQMTSNVMTLDVSQLSEGIHTFHVQMGDSRPVVSALFYNTYGVSDSPTEYHYAFNGNTNYTLGYRDTTGTFPSSWIDLMAVDTFPFCSQRFHFEIDTANQPWAYSKNVISVMAMAKGHILTGEKSYIDRRVGYAVMADTFARNTYKQFAKPTNNHIQWYQVAVDRGDSMAFKASQPCTMQLFDPEGQEVYRVANDTATEFSGLHAWQDGTYYLAVHDATYRGTENLRVDYLRINKHCLLAYTPHEIGNRANSTFDLRLMGNGFDSIAFIKISQSSDSLDVDTIISKSRTDMELLVRIDGVVTNGLYDIQLGYYDEGETIDTITVLQALRLDSVVIQDVAVSFSTPSNMALPFPIVVTVENRSNIDYTHLPLNIAFTNPDAIEEVRFENFSIGLSAEADSAGISNIIYTNNLLGEHNPGVVMFTFIPRLGASCSKELELGIVAGAHTRFDMYAWTGDPVEIRPVVAAPDNRSNAKDNPSGYADNPGKGRKAVGDPERAANILAAADIIDNVGGALPRGAGAATSIGTNAMRTGVLIGSISNALDHSVDMAVLDAYGIDPSDPLYEEIAGLHPPLSCPFDYVPGADLLRMLGLLGGCAQQPQPDPGDPYHAHIVTPGDPNDISGYLSASGSHYVPREVMTMPYEIEFENAVELASAAAHTIVVRDTLDGSMFDLSSFGATSVNIGGDILRLNGESSLIRTMDLRPRMDIIAQIELDYDSVSGVAEWRLTALDPISLEPSDDIDEGLLPVNYDGTGVGHVNFHINRRDVDDGVVINNKADIVFDHEQPISTPLWTNIVDTIFPTSRICYGNLLNGVRTLCFEGNDNRSGVWQYALYGRRDSLSSWELMKSDIEESYYADTSSSQISEYYVVATDSAGNVETKVPLVEYSATNGVTGTTIPAYKVVFANHNDTLSVMYLTQFCTPNYIGSTPIRMSTESYSYSFSGWSPALAPITGPVTYHAVFDSIPKNFLVSFFGSNGDTLQSDSIAYGTMPVYSGDVPAGYYSDSMAYAFTGWNPPLGLVQGATIYRAAFDSCGIDSLPRCVVIFVDWNVSILYRDSLSFGSTPYYGYLNPTRAVTPYYHYSFAGWSSDVMPVSGNATYRALYDSTAIRYAVRFVNYNGATLQEDSLAYGDTAVYAGHTPARRTTRSHTYHFVGWSRASSVVTGDATYTAQFDSVLNRYTVTFVGINGDTLRQQTLNYGDSIIYTEALPTLPDEEPNRYVFREWSPNVTTITDNCVLHPIFDTTFFCTDKYLSQTLVVCDSAVWRGRMLTVSGTYADTVDDASYGQCDSIYTLQLTVSQSHFIQEQHSICQGDSYLWHGESLTTAGVYYDSLQSVGGCDSVYELTLAVNPAYIVQEQHSICQGNSYSWHGESLTTAGVYHDSLQTMAGCDSVYELTLTVNPTYMVQEQHSICQGDSYSWHGENLIVAGVYYDSLQSVGGCDSVFELTLTVNPTYMVEDSVELPANGMGYQWHGNTYYVAGDYVDTLATVYGCDSICTLHLTEVTLVPQCDSRNITITLVPNPIRVGDIAYIHADWTEAERNGMTVEIFTAAGRSVVRTQPTTFPIPINGITASGTYVIRITTGTKDVYIRKLIVN